MRRSLAFAVRIQSIPIITVPMLTSHTSGRRLVRRRARPSVLALTLVLAGACSDSPAAPLRATAPTVVAATLPLSAVAAAAMRRPIPDEYIVVLQDSVRDVPGQAQRLIAQAGGAHRFTYTGVFKGFAAHLSARAAAALERHPLVQRVEQDQVVTADEITQGSAPWGLDRIDQGALPLDGLYRYTATAPTVTAYIIDSGLR
ncbi:MAG TPA: protease inhibitor I9 family protein, partial [Gemmatimonadaceae bacterium]|nr:protease inhibitor I9 family protein [Gemmatimonadaceae bacterium]